MPHPVQALGRLKGSEQGTQSHHLLCKSREYPQNLQPRKKSHPSVHLIQCKWNRKVDTPQNILGGALRAAGGHRAMQEFFSPGNAAVGLCLASFFPHVGLFPQVTGHLSTHPTPRKALPACVLGILVPTSALTAVLWQMKTWTNLPAGTHAKIRRKEVLNQQN